MPKKQKNINKNKKSKSIKTDKLDFVFLIAHQLQTPASAIKWSLKTLLDGEVGEVSDKQKEFINEIYKNNERIIILINELLNAASIKKGKSFYNLELVDPGLLFKSVVDFNKKKIEQKELKINLDIPAEKMPLVAVDTEKIKMAFQNLLDNAIKYTMPGGLITISISYDKKNIKVKIQDTGIGIPKSQQKKVFSKFFRGENIKKIKSEGIGLGLFLTKSIIQAHGGKIWFESEENKGSTFYFTLPISR